MKAIKYLIMGVLLAGFSTTANAQEEELNAAISAIKSKAANVADLAKAAYKKNKKDPEALMKIARAYFEQKDTAGANQFAHYANEAYKPKNAYAPAWMLLGDIEAGFGSDGGKAAGYYNQAINFDPKNPDGYKKWAMVYRKISPTQAEAKLKDMEKNCPGEDANAMIGHIYMLSYASSKSSKDEKAAYEAFKKADINKFDKVYLNEFARASYFQGHYDDALSACEAGLKIEPRNPTFVRLCMFANYEKKDYEKAKSYINRYFNETDSAKFSEYDHYYTALIYQELGEKDKMYAEYDKALELVNDSSMIKRWDIQKAISDSYLKDLAFDNAIKYYQEMLACKPNLSYDDEEGLAKIYAKYAEADEARKPELISKSIEIYKKLGDKYPVQAIYSAYQCATMNNKLDPTMAKSLAKPDYQRVVSLLENKADRDKSENTILKYSYHYLMSNAFLIGKNKAQAKEYAEKILAIDPEYKPAIDIMNLK